MTDEYRPIPFRWILPVAQLLLCVAMIWPLRHAFIYEIRASVNDYRTHTESTPNQTTYPRDLMSYGTVITVEDIHRINRLVLRVRGPSLLNFPAALVELPYAIATSEKMPWIPRGMSLWSWRAISWPLVGTVLWWLAGRGIEALVAAFRGIVHPALGYVEAAIGLLLTLFGALVFLFPLIYHEARADLDFPWGFASLAGAIWMLLGGAIIAARVMQWRIRRRAAAQTNGDAIPA